MLKSGNIMGIREVVFFPIYGLTSIGKSHRKYEFGEEETWDPVLEANSKIGLRRKQNQSPG